MSRRLDQERESKLQPKRYNHAVKELTSRGFLIEILDDTQFRFLFKDEWVNYYPYSGWASGKTIKDGRGFDNLIKQLN